MLLFLGSSHVNSATLSWEKRKAHLENTCDGKHLAKTGKQGSAEAGRRDGRGSLEMGSYCLGQGGLPAASLA